MYTYNKDDKSYTFSSDDLNIEDLIDTNNNSNDNANNNNNGDTQNIDKPPGRIFLFNIPARWYRLLVL